MLRDTIKYFYEHRNCFDINIFILEFNTLIDVFLSIVIEEMKGCLFE